MSIGCHTESFGCCLTGTGTWRQRVRRGHGPTGGRPAEEDGADGGQDMLTTERKTAETFQPSGSTFESVFDLRQALMLFVKA